MLKVTQIFQRLVSIDFNNHFGNREDRLLLLLTPAPSVGMIGSGSSPPCSMARNGLHKVLGAAFKQLYSRKAIGMRFAMPVPVR